MDFRIVLFLLYVTLKDRERSSILITGHSKIYKSLHFYEKYFSIGNAKIELLNNTQIIKLVDKYL